MMVYSRLTVSIHHLVAFPFIVLGSSFTVLVRLLPFIYKRTAWNEVKAN